ncbi:MAG: DNA polymerase III subunit alpha, partial [Proteobacteria bacterium]|nr:DNA polymerase III subunit alpha [Pseudomonadota bacterium]
GRLELAVFSDMFQEYRDLLIKDTLLIVKGEVSVDEYSGGFKMRANEIFSIDQAQQAFARRLALRLDASQFKNGLLPQLMEILKPDEEGQCAVTVHYTNNNAEADLMLGNDWRIKLTHSTLEHLTELAGEGRVEVFYGRA